MTFRRPHTVALLAAIGIAAALFYQYRQFYHDDAFISLRYVRNFLNGDGLCWNPGERVEGYSNFLLVMIVAALGRLGLDLVIASRLVGILSFILLAGFVLNRSHRLQNEQSNTWLALLPVIFTITALPLNIWSLGGLETSLFAFLVTVGVVLVSDGLKDAGRSLLPGGILLGLASLCRPDGLLFVIAGTAFVAGRGAMSVRRIDKRVFGFLAGAFALIVPHLIWRYWYYESWVPNTYYVKAANLGEVLPYGLTYFKEYALAAPFVLILISAFLLMGVMRRSISAPACWYLMVIIVYVVYVISIGGDHMPAFRLLAPLAPLGGWLIYEMLAVSDSKMPNFVSAAIVSGMLVLCAGQLVFPAEKYARAKVMDGAAFLGSAIGKYIDTNWPEGSLVALNTAGSTPYYAPKLRFIDMLGLNDTTIARRERVPMRTKMQQWPGHGKGDGVYVVSRRPDYIITGPSNGDYANNFPWFLSDYELGGSEEFLRQYQPVRVIIPAADPGHENYTESSLGGLRFVYYQRRK